MTALKIENFGGELPSVSARALPPEAAQVNADLFLATSEFRPLATDGVVLAAPPRTESIYRFARNATGVVNAHPATGWVLSGEQRSYVKGQLNDDSTERTYFSTDDGSAPLRAVTAGAPSSPRFVGVPAPMKPAVAKVENDEVTPEEALDFVSGAAVQQIHDALVSSVRNVSNTVLDVGRRGADGLPTAGPRQMWGMRYCDDAILQGAFADKPYYAVSVIGYNYAEQMGLKFAELDARPLPLGGGPYSWLAVPINTLAFAYWIDQAAARAALKAVVFPSTGFAAKNGQRVLTDAQVEDVLKAAVDWFVADNYARAHREKLDAEVQAYVKLLVAAPPNAHEAVMSMRESIVAATHEVNKRSVERLKQFSENSLWVKEWLASIGGVSKVVGTTTKRIIDTRFYFATFVTDWGEESAPSEPVGPFEVDQNDGVSVARPALPPGETVAGRNIAKWRIYRSNAGTQTAAFQYVDEVNINTTSYTDTKKGAELGEPCPTIMWAMPPKRASGTNPHMRGLVGMPNGIMAGFYDNVVAFCEPYVPYAWPVEYQISTEYPVVGLGVFGQTVFVGTEGNPYFISGASSASMSSVKLDVRQACASRRSIAAVQGGVLYASPDGLCAADPSGVRVVSAGAITREDWQKLEPSTMVAHSHENIYYLRYFGQGGGCLAFDLQSKKFGRTTLLWDAAFSDTITDAMYIAEGGSVRAVFSGSGRRLARWRSPLVTQPAHTSLAWLKVYGSQTAADPVVVRLYGDGGLRHQATVPDLNPVRLPPGRWLEVEVEIESRARVTRVVLASSTKELQAV